MRTPESLLIDLRIGFTATLLALSLTGCGDSPLTPDEAGAQDASTRAMLDQIIDKLESIEERLDSIEGDQVDHEAMLAQLDAIETVVEGLGGTVGGGGGVVLDELYAHQLDSLMVLSSYLAEETLSGGFEFCAEFGVDGDFGFEWVGAAEFEGAGHLGAWAGTGAYAGGKLTSEATLGAGLKLAAAAKGEWCHPLFAGDGPPSRPSPAGALRAPARGPASDALETLAGQLNLNEASLVTAINGIGSAVASPSGLSLQNIGSTLPLPPAIAAVASDPLGHVSARISGLTANASAQMCSASWGSNLATIVSQACSLIAGGGLPSPAFLANLSSTYPAVSTAISNVCARVNTIGLQRLIISSWDVTFPLGIGTVQVFPGYNQRLFPAYTSLACP